MPNRPHFCLSDDLSYYNSRLRKNHVHRQPRFRQFRIKIIARAVAEGHHSHGGIAFFGQAEFFVQDRHIRALHRHRVDAQRGGGEQSEAHVDVHLFGEPFGFVLELVAVNAQEGAACAIAAGFKFGPSWSSFSKISVR